MPISVEQLNEWADDFDRQISAIDKQIASLQEKRNELQSKRTAVDCLTDSASNRQGTRLVPAQSGSARPSLGGRREHAPQSAYRMPILEVLVEIGGKGHVEEILPKVKLKMELAELLRQGDYGDVPSGGEEYWRNLTRWERKALVDRGLLRRDSPRGIWEITSEGREWLRKNKP